MPGAGDLDLGGLDVEEADVAEALANDPEEWRAELPRSRSGSRSSREKLPTAVRDEYEALKERLTDAG